MNVCLRVCMYVCIYVYIYMCVCVLCVYIRVCVFLPYPFNSKVTLRIVFFSKSQSVGQWLCYEYLCLYRILRLTGSPGITRTHGHTHTHMHVCIYIYIYINLYVYIYIYIMN